MSGSLEGQIAFVTGAGSGIGRACALALAEAGAAVACFDRNPASNRATTDLLTPLTAVAAVEGDVSSEEQVIAAVEQATRALGAPTIVINAAGIAVRKRLLDTSAADWAAVLATNLTGYFYVLRATVPAMARAGGGRIVQIASITGHIGYAYPAYTAAKGGVLALTRQLAAELAPLGIRINSVSPGVVETGLNQQTLEQAAIRRETIERIPHGRLGASEDIARAVLFLASDAADFITGADLVVDGGMISSIHWGAGGAALRAFHSSGEPA